MNIIICGAGEVGRHTAEVLGADGHNITIIDKNNDKLLTLEDVMDVRVLPGSGTHAQVLREAGCANADLYIAATHDDEINLLSASIATGVGADRSIARVHHSTYFEKQGLDYAQHLGIDHLVCPEHTTALAIAQALRNPGAIDVERFARGKVEMQQLRVSPDAQVVGKPLTKLSLPASARLAAIERGDTAFIPDGETVIQAGDIVTLIGEVSSFDKASKLFHKESDRRKRVMLMGGTALSVWICRALSSRDFSVRLFETNPQRAQELAAKLEWVTVLRVDPMDTDTLTLERIDQADTFVAATNDDENNILAGARAKSMGAKCAIAVLQRSTYLHLLEHVGIDKAFSSQVTAAAKIKRLIEDSPMRHLASLAEGIAEVYEIHVPNTAKQLIREPLRTVKFPPKTIIAAIQRGDEVFIPGANDWIAPDDTVVVITPANQQKQLKAMFAVK